MSISIITRGNFLKLSGNDSSVEIAKNLLNHLYENVKKNNFLDEGEVKGQSIYLEILQIKYTAK